MLSKCFYETPLERFSVFRKFDEFFNPKKLTNLMLADGNFNENFTVDVSVGNFYNV